jgi:hypothetical protein
VKKASELRVEVNQSHVDQTVVMGGGMVLVNPTVGEGYWALRVQVAKTQAVIAFRKFGMFGIGFQKEKSYDCNLPWCCGTSEIYNCIACNRARANPEVCKKAIRLIQETIFRNNLDPVPQRMEEAKRAGIK